jgi:CBS domain-containing protein
MAMQMVSEVMTRDVRFVSPQEDVQHAAQMMGELDVGVLPVCDGGRLVGMVTDRDITIRSTAAGKSPREAHVDEVMSRDVRWCFEDQPLDEVMIQMADSQIRRVPVVSHDDQHRLVGIVALGDVATRSAQGPQKTDVEQVVEMVSSPAEPAQGHGTGGGAASGSMNSAGNANASAGSVSLADGTRAAQSAGKAADSDVQEAGREPGGMSSAEGAQAISDADANSPAPGNVSLADGTRSGGPAAQQKSAGMKQAMSAGGEGGMSAAQGDGTADQVENTRGGAT